MTTARPIIDDDGLVLRRRQSLRDYPRDKIGAGAGFGSDDTYGLGGKGLAGYRSCGNQPRTNREEADK